MSLPLADIRVVDVSTVLAGPNCARYLADFGADVIKVERPDGGDSLRNMAWRDPRDGGGLWWKLVNRNKRAIALDLKSDRDREVLFAFVADCAAAFGAAYVPLVERHHAEPWDEREARWLALRRGRYVEFNLMYDRGTRFGLRTGGRVESILMSLPLLARWEYAQEPEPGSPEAATVAVLRQPRAWV